MSQKCLLYIYLSEYGGYSSNYKYMGPYRHASIAPLKKWYIFLKVIFVNAFSPITTKNIFFSFLMKLVEMPKYFYLLSSFIFSVLISKYNSSRNFILFLISKQKHLVQYVQKNWSNPISQLVNFWVYKTSVTSEVMCLCESCWIFFQYIYLLFLK